MTDPEMRAIPVDVVEIARRTRDCADAIISGDTVYSDKVWGALDDAATALETLAAERDALKAAKWDVKHTGTMNDMVLMGLARDEASERATAAEARAEMLAAEHARLREAVEPSGDTKAAYHGEFAFELFDGVSDAGVDQHRKVYVPWDTVKQIMAAIRIRAALSPVTQVKESGRG